MIRASLAGLLVALVLALTGCFDDGSPSGAGPTVRATAPLLRLVTNGPPVSPGAIVRPIRVGYGPYEARYGLGRVWVANVAGIVSVDPVSGKPVGRANLHNDSEWSNVALGGGAVWFLGGRVPAGMGPQAMLVSVNATTVQADAPIMLDHTGKEAFENVGASPDGVCAGRVGGVPSSSAGTVCVSDTPGAAPFFVRAGPGPLLGVSDGTIWIGGWALVRLNPRTRTTHTVAVAKGGKVIALVADGDAVWAAVNYSDHSAELWQITDHQVDRRIAIRTGYVTSIASIGEGLWVMLAGRHSNRIDVVLPSGALRPVARVPQDARSLTASPAALWTTRYQSGVVLEISKKG
jgi:hypothetical protein